MNPGLRDAVLRLHDRSIAAYAVLSVAPPVFYLQLPLDHVDHFFHRYDGLFNGLRDRSAYCLCGFTWWLSDALVDRLRVFQDQVGEVYPNLRLVFLCGEERDVDRLAAWGGRAVFVHQNCLLDESIYRPYPDVERRFDAVYDARLVPWKRHALARGIDRLALIYGRFPVEDEAFERQVRSEFHGAHWFNEDAGGNYLPINADQVAAALAQCRVGLCLSEEEGGMYASAQYLLCGLPVVTTPSRGGRDVFFDPGFVLTVPPDPTAIRDAVRDLAGRRLDGNLIRDATLARCVAHRRTLIGLVQSILDAEGASRSFEADWRRVFRNKLVRKLEHAVTLARIREATE